MNANYLLMFKCQGHPFTGWVTVQVEPSCSFSQHSQQMKQTVKADDICLFTPAALCGMQLHFPPHAQNTHSNSDTLKCLHMHTQANTPWKPCEAAGLWGWWYPQEKPNVYIQTIQNGTKPSCCYDPVCEWSTSKHALRSQALLQVVPFYWRVHN